MPFTVLVCVDGSELAEAALVDGLAVLKEHERTVIATVIETRQPDVYTRPAQQMIANYYATVGVDALV